MFAASWCSTPNAASCSRIGFSVGETSPWLSEGSRSFTLVMNVPEQAGGQFWLVLRVV